MRCVAPNVVCVEGELHPFFYSGVWSVWRQQNRKPAKTAYAWWHATARGAWAREAAVGVRPHPGCAKPWWAHLTTAFAWSVPGWAWTLPPLVLGPGCCVKVGFSISLIAHFCCTLSVLRLLLGFPLVFKCVSCKTCFLQYKWNFVNSKVICVKRLFISPILDFNWQSDLIDSDRQQSSKT